MNTTLDLTADIINVSEICERVEELESERDAHPIPEDAGLADDTEAANAAWEAEFPDDAEELRGLSEILDDLKGSGGNHKWRGDWYPDSLIADHHFEDYAQQLAEDIGAIDPNAGWPLAHIDWEAAAKALLNDYSEVDVDSNTYYYR